MSDTDQAHEIVSTPGVSGGWIHHCERCGYIGRGVPPLPCRGPAAALIETASEAPRGEQDEA